MDSTLVSQPSDIADQARSDRSPLHVPRSDRAFLVRPPLSDSQKLLAENLARLDRQDTRLFGISLSELRADVRDECLQAAQKFTRLVSPATKTIETKRCDQRCETSNRPIVATGHQPELFHLGVWIKNVAVSELAARENAIGLNLIVDNDLVEHRSIRLPAQTESDSQTQSTSDLGWQQVAFDQTSSARLPWEEAVVCDESMFGQFTSRVSESLSRWSIEPICNKHWQAGVDLGAGQNLCARLSAVRVRLETELGFSNLELPMSEVCATRGFRCFLFAVLFEIKRFVVAHNSALKSFRKLNRIRSHTHPVPELASSGDYFETPFWVWSRTDPIRRPLFVRLVGEELILGTALDGSGEFARLPNRASDADAAHQILKSLHENGMKIRTRALSTTMFIRMFLCDLFVHGIGGAKYDELTDDIIRDFFGIEPPEFLTISYTAHLPFAKPYPESALDISSIKQRIRDLQQSPQRFIDVDTTPEVAKLVAEKNRLIADQHAAEQSTGTFSKDESKARRAASVRRYRRFPEINRALAQQTKPLVEDALAKLQRIRRNLVVNQFITNREFSYCAFPEARLRELIDELKLQFETPTE